MKLFEFYISYISWGSDGKYRPVLVFSLKDDVAFVYPVTSQYENKSETIRAKYFKINDWPQAGPDKQSYVDTGICFSVPISALRNKTPMVQLSVEDTPRLINFLSKRVVLLR